MNRWCNQFALTFEKRIVKVFARVTIGGTGAPTLDAVNSKGIVSVTRSSAGIYVFVFGTRAGLLDTYVGTACVHAIFNTAGNAGALPAAPICFIKSSSISTPAVASMTLEFTNNAASPAATDPASGEVMHVEFTFRDSTAP